MMRKCKLLTIVFFLITTFFYSCRRDDSLKITDTLNKYSKETVLKVKANSNAGDNGDNNEEPSSQEEARIQSQVSLNISVPSNTSEEQLVTYINQNISSVNGEIVFKVNGEIFYKSVVKNGVETILIGSPTAQGGRDGECSYEGIRQCANKSIYAMGTVSKIVCAFGFYQCYAVAAADCIEKNCINKSRPVVPFEIIPESEIDIPGNNSGYTPPQNALPGTGTKLFNYAESIDRMKAHIYGKQPTYPTKIFLKDNLYYADANFTCILPNGYYTNDRLTVYLIEYGQVLNTLIMDCKDCPYPTSLSTQSDPFIGCGLNGSEPD
ncbi:hypothetical protein [Sphingobacterium sp. BIGb0165]|uniref:hypothetical protein n=1 Tax=Sphingobacterium sp. BIGb0165 TaxID=2940615 RepID=UPI00216804B9|nr:hypothetical protein [Sphingobacterium sp. BIGb0165]MCS4225156.1 hypothetical protein [Sphingobacterium sp. BIGb0165]